MGGYLLATEFGTGQVLWSLLWVVLFVGWVASYVLACMAIWRYVGRSETGATRVVFTVLAALALLAAYGVLIGVVIGVAIVFFDRKATKATS